MFAAGSGNFCPKCDKRVYFAEQVLAFGKHWHKTCFTCANAECNKRLDGRNMCDHNGRPYCQHCHKKLFGPKGYGFGTLHTGDAESTENRPPEFARAQAASMFDRSSSDLSAVSNGMDNGREHSVSPVSGTKYTSPASTGHRHSSYASSGASPRPAFVSPQQQKDLCRRCGKMVYFAEKVIGAGAVWHKIGCFTCASCNAGLRSSNLCENQNEIYCKNCYGRHFGPKGYGFSGGAGTLMSAE